jgi:hypothetical protein
MKRIAVALIVHHHIFSSGRNLQKCGRRSQPAFLPAA